MTICIKIYWCIALVFYFFLNCCRSCRIAWNWLDRDYILSNSRFTQWDFKIKIDTLVFFLHNTVREYLFSDPIYRYINVINARNLVVYCEICQSKFCIEGESCPCFSIDKDYIKRYLNSLNSFYAFDILLTKNRHDWYR